MGDGEDTDENQTGAGPTPMTADDPSQADAPPDAVVDQSSPTAAARLAVPVPPSAPAETATVNRKRSGSENPRRGKPPRGAASSPQPPARRRKLSPLKRLERYVSAIFKLGRTEYMAKNARKRITAAELRMDAIEGELGRFGQDIRETWERSDDLGQVLDGLQDRFDGTREEITALNDRFDQQRDAAEGQARDLRAETAAALRAAQSETALLARLFGDLTRRIDRMAQADGSAPAAPMASADPVALPSSDGFALFKDSFYHRLENRYRGSVEEISRRLAIYLPDVEAAHIRTGRKPAMDIGCGRGEWLGLLRDNGIEAFGVDTNPVQIEAAKEQGLDVRQGDALQALAEMEDGSLSLITAHHLVEHLPFDAVAWIAREAMRVLAPGGVLLFETPNTRNVLVGATTFHTDPTHLKPMPEQVLGVLFETAGFDPVDIRHLHPHERMGEFLEKPDFNDELAFLMFGPQDLAVLGTKPNKD